MIQPNDAMQKLLMHCFSPLLERIHEWHFLKMLTEAFFLKNDLHQKFAEMKKTVQTVSPEIPILSYFNAFFLLGGGESQE